MSNNRRDFLKTIGGGTATLGLGGITLSSCSSNTGDSVSSPEQTLEVSQDGAIVETRSGKVRGYRRNGIYTYKGIPYGGTHIGKEPFYGAHIARAMDRDKECPGLGAIRAAAQNAGNVSKCSA